MTIVIVARLNGGYFNRNALRIGLGYVVQCVVSLAQTIILGKANVRHPHVEGLSVGPSWHVFFLTKYPESIQLELV